MVQKAKETGGAKSRPAAQADAPRAGEGQRLAARRQRRGLAPARRPAAPPARHRRLAGDGRLALRRDSGDLERQRRDPLLGRALQSGLGAGGEAPRSLRPRSPPHPPQHPRRAAGAGVGKRPRHARARRAAGADPCRGAHLEHRDPRRGPGLRRQLHDARRDPLLLAAPDRRRGRPRARPQRRRRPGRAADRHPPRGAPAARRLPGSRRGRGRGQPCHGSARSTRSPGSHRSRASNG